MVKKQEKSMRRFGLLGRNISYSFSKSYFFKKFKSENIDDASYENFDIESIDQFPLILSNIKGFNVTIPYKEVVIPYLNGLNKKAKAIGAVNTIKVSKKGKLKGYNTDCYGFKKSLQPHLKNHHTSALILGTGGASKAVAFTLKELNINYKFVSRSVKDNTMLNYSELTEDIIKDHTLIINCTPLGTFPNIKDCPNIPYNGVTDNHILYDLIYNPEETQFLKNGKLKGAKTINGHLMLVLQAEKAWKIWNS